MLATLVQKHGGECASGDPETEILGVQLDSRAVVEGDLFVAVKGDVGDGRAYISQAVTAGARAVLVDELPADGVFAGVDGVPVWVHREARRVAGLAAAQVLGDPSGQLDVFAITGTNGKTTTAHLIGELLSAVGRTPAVIGTTGVQLARNVSLDTTHTTPDAPDLQRLLARHRELDGDCVVLEVSSHALCQHRTSGLDIDFGIYTNLSRDHLDYHGDMQQYACAKSLMFSSLKSNAVAILNQDDSWFEMMQTAARKNGARVVTYSAEESADLQASELEFDTDATYLTLSGMGISLARLRIPLSGRFNVSNVLAASAAVLMSGASPSAVVAGLASVSSPTGRMERVALDVALDSVGGDACPTVFVDYAHTPDALSKALGVLRELARAASGRVICVFGCGGDRDGGKRAAMGDVASELSDVVYVTSDNPRTEDPAAILDDIRAGIRAGACVHYELDRRLAIRAALREARPADLVLIAGKGHESVQVIGSQRQPFDDRLVAREEWA